MFFMLCSVGNLESSRFKKKKKKKRQRTPTQPTRTTNTEQKTHHPENIRQI